MRKIINKLMLFIGDAKINIKLPVPTIHIGNKWLLLFFVVLSSISTYISFRRGYIVAYNDARSHLNMARLVFDNLNPGFAQIGSVWLPLNHVFNLFFVWNDWMWQSGLAGGIFSMIFYVLSCIVLHKLILIVVKDRGAALLGVLVFATNLNILYMQSTPMTELTLIFFFTATTYFLYRWINSNNTLDLIYTAICVFFATLTRYDGWLLLIVATGVVTLNTAATFVEANTSLASKIKSLYKNMGIIEGKTILFATLASFGIVLWLLWNLAIFKDPLYFAYGPYSAHSQQLKIEQAGSLLTKFNLPLSIEAFWWAVVNNAGFLIAVFSILGLFAYLVRNKLNIKAIAIYTLLVPVAFHIISLYLGHSILILPELGVHVTEKVSASWFNVRYGLVIIPAVALFAAYLSARDVIAKIILIGLLVIQPIIFFSTNNIITLTDGVVGTSSLEVGDVAEWLRVNAKDESDLILTSVSFNNALVFTAGLPLKRIIHEGTGHYWETALKDPAVHARWIVMANGDVGDLVYDALIKKENPSFLKRFRLVKRFTHLNVYERISVPENFVYVENKEFMVNGSPYRFIGFNSYDLIYRTPEEVNETISKAESAGARVIRFWAFGDGIDHGTQPRAGVYNESRLKTLDIIAATAKQHDMKLIITFVNYWGDYGGIAQYLEWSNLPWSTPGQLDRFYTDPTAKSYFKDYIRTLVSRKNTVSGDMYVNDPAIFAWELANEPRTANLSSSKVMLDWAEEMSNFIRSMDKSHLVLTGAEGFLTNPDFTSTHTGPMFDDLAQLESAQGLTAHYYVQREELLSPEFRHPVLSEWKRKSDMFGKPMIVEEVGFSKKDEDNNNVDRLTLYGNLLEEAEGHGIQGVMLWNWALALDDNFGISPNDPTDTELIKLIKSYSERIKN